MKAFPQILKVRRNSLLQAGRRQNDVILLQVLYNKDCVSDQAIIYWHQKGSKPQGRQHFLKATEGLVKVTSYYRKSSLSDAFLYQFLQEQDESDEE